MVGRLFLAAALRIGTQVDRSVRFAEHLNDRRRPLACEHCHLLPVATGRRVKFLDTLRVADSAAGHRVSRARNEVCVGGSFGAGDGAVSRQLGGGADVRISCFALFRPA